MFQVSFYRRAVSVGMASLRASPLDVLQWVVVLGLLTECFRGQGRPFTILLGVFVLPLLRYVMDLRYRQRSTEHLRLLVEQLQSFATTRAAIPWRAVFVLVIFPVGLIYLSTDRTLGSGDTWPVIPGASSLVRQGNLEISEYLATIPQSYWQDDPLPYCVAKYTHGIYTLYPSGMQSFAVPVCVVARLVGADLDSPKVRNRLEKWTAAWLAAAITGMFFLVALHGVSLHAAIFATIYFSFGSVMFSTVSQGLWQHGGVIFWILLTILVELRLAPQRPRVAALLQGLACGQMFAVRMSSALWIAPFGLWLLSKSWQRGLLAFLGGVIGYLPWAIWYYSTYHTPFGPSFGFTKSSYWGITADGIQGVLFSPGRGLLLYQPWVALSIVGIWMWIRYASTAYASMRALTLVGITTVVLQVLLIASWTCWSGGDCWGSRLLAEIVPPLALLTLPVIAVLVRSRTGVVTLLMMAIAAISMHVPGVYRDQGLERTEAYVWSWPPPAFTPVRKHSLRAVEPVPPQQPNEEQQPKPLES